MPRTPIIIPQPKSVRMAAGTYRLPAKGIMAISDSSLYASALELGEALPQYPIESSGGGQAEVTITLAKLGEEEYRLRIGPRGVAIAAGSARGAFYGVQTLLQIMEQSGEELPALTIRDKPDLKVRGVYLDVTRGRVPTLESLMAAVDELSRYKVNEFQIYLEHTFAFRSHPDIGKGASPLTAEEILELDEFCRERHVELVPSFASFGHMSSILKLKKYRHLAEDWGIGKYIDPEAHKHSCVPGWSLAPSNPDIYPFLDSLFAELLPLFSSKKFNVCCDETWDLGLGQSYDLAQKKGKAKLYLNHILKLRKMVKKHGRQMQIWGDIIRNHPELVPSVPKDIAILDWSYHSEHDFDSIREFTATGAPTYACPGVASWRSLFPQIHKATANIAGFAAAAKKHGADGLLNTDWGDGGHYNFMEYSWHGYLFGAEQSWNTRADQKTFTRRFCEVFFGIDAPDLAAAIVELGDITQLEVPQHYQSAWEFIFFEPAGGPALNLGKQMCWVAKKGKIGGKKLNLDASFGRAVVKQLKVVRRVFEKYAKKSGVDPLGVLPYWIFAVDTTACAARKLTVLGEGGRNTPANRAALRKELRALMKRFEKLWMARSKRSEIRITLNRYRKVFSSLR